VLSAFSPASPFCLVVAPMSVRPWPSPSGVAVTRPEETRQSLHSAVAPGSRSPYIFRRVLLYSPTPAVLMGRTVRE